jgi:hypothetical protein
VEKFVNVMNVASMPLSMVYDSIEITLSVNSDLLLPSSVNIGSHFPVQKKSSIAILRLGEARTHL